MNTVSKLKRMLRGEVSARTVSLEVIRRIRVTRTRQREREQLAELAQPARLGESFAQMKPADLLAHFQSRATPEFLPGLASASESAKSQASLFPNETAQL
ncbi:MAG TPA: hypothetical protein VLQ90_09990, partial [Pyrinomonadaceae bacterium]|nr:hypothetical protein [Pyrinomonadaceae bacterium]